MDAAGAACDVLLPNLVSVRVRKMLDQNTCRQREVYLLMHVVSSQAGTRLQERHRVRRAAHGGRFHPAQQHVSTVPQVK